MRPQTITAAVICIALSTTLAAVETVELLLGDSGLPVRGHVLTVIFLAFVTWGFATGRGWTRWPFTVVYLFGSVAGVIALLLKPEARSSFSPSFFVHLALQTAALLLACLRGSRAWFRRGVVEDSRATGGVV